MSIPELRFEPPEDWPPTDGKYETRDYYTKRTPEEKTYWEDRISELVNNMEKRETEFRLCLMYDPEMEKHFTDEIYTSHNGIVLKPYPECPERIQGIWKCFRDAGIIESKDVLKLETGRLVTEEECCLVHSKLFWQNWIESDSFSVEEREKLAKSYNSIYLNIDSVRCARLAAGGALSCVDSVISNKARSGWAVVRPPGHHADITTCAGFNKIKKLIYFNYESLHMYFLPISAKSY